MADNKPYDLLLRGGHVICPASGINGVMDVAVRDGKIAAVQKDILPNSAREVVDLRGRLVLPGMIDTHAHVYRYVSGRFGLDADMVGVHSGVTTLIDQGGPSCMTLPGFRHFVAETANSQVYAFLSSYLVGGLEGHLYPALYSPDCINIDATVRAANANKDLVRGIKGHAEIGGFARWGIKVLQMSAEIGRQTNLPLYVHFGQLWGLPRSGANGEDADTILERVIPELRPGDILAHPFTRHPGGFVNREGQVHEVIRAALDRGLKVDVGHGSHFSYRLARQWRLASMQLRHQDPEIQTGGRRRLLAMAAGSGPEQTRAISFLLSSQQLQPEEVNLLLRLFPDRPGAQLDERLVRLGLENLNDPSGRATRTRKLAEPYWNVEGRSNLVYIATWMGQRAAFLDILEAVPEEQALTDGRLYLNRAGALGELERWKEVESLLTNPAAPEMPMLQEILRASAMHAAGRTNESLGHWKQALTLATTDRAMLQSIARLSESRGYTQVALEAWRPLLGDPRVAPRAAAEVLRLAGLTRNLQATRDALRRLDQLGALPPPQRVYLALHEAMLNPDLTRARNLISRSASKSTETNLTAVANALLALRENQPDLAARELDALQVNWEEAPLLWQVVRVAQLGRAGRRTEAREFARHIDVSALSAPERTLIEPWMPMPE